MELITNIVNSVNTFLWDYALLILLLGSGIFFTFMLRFIQIRKFGAGMKALLGNFSLHGESGENGLSSFQALTTAIAAQVGTGNIAGAATAIASGGPGAIFWMWISAFFGMATIYAEAVMAQHTRAVKDGPFVGGGFPGGGADAVLPSRGLCGGLRGSGALGVHLGIRGCRAGILPGNPVSPFSVLPAAVAVSGGERRPWGENPREVSGGGISPPGGGDFLRNGGKSGNSFIFFAVKRIQHVEEWGFPGQHVVFFM